MRASRILTTLTLILPAFAFAPTAAASQHGGSSAPRPDELRTHYQRLVPQLLLKSGVPGVAVGVIHEGKVSFIDTWGEARVATGAPVRRQTLFNVGSIAKPLTAWGVMRLVESGKVDLDAPVWQYVHGWKVPDGPHDPRGVTVRRLLSHMAGLSMPAVPDTPAAEARPGTLASLGDPSHPVLLEREPGSEWSYSGGGYILLQLLVEEVSGRPFAAFMEDEVLRPLGMRHSRFGRPADEGRAGLAKGYDAGKPAPDLQWGGLSAAGLYTTVEDLARFVAISSSPETWMEGAEGVRVLTPESVRMLATPAPGTVRPYTTRYGLGHDLWPLPDGSFAAGHNGQNTGWSATAWWLPDTGEGVVALTNDSDGMDVHRWVMCDWVAWAVEPAFGGYCRGRLDEPAGTLSRTVGGPNRDEAPQAWAARVEDGEPGGVLAIRRWGRALTTQARGVRDLETGAPLEAGTPFYIASVAKPITAALVKELAARGVIDEWGPVGPDFPEIPTLDDVRVAHLRDHTAGVRDYHDLIDLGRLGGQLDNRGVIDTLANHPQLTHAPGQRFAYTSSHYVLLAELMRRRTGRTYAQILQEAFGTPLELESLWVDDGSESAPAEAARGYRPEGDGFRLSSYETVDLPGAAPVVTMAFATTGAGGVYLSAEDLARWGESQLVRLGGRHPRALVPVADDGLGALVGTLRGFREGWFVSELEGRTVYWHDGNRAGYEGVLAIVPAEGIVAAFLANRSDLVPEEIVEEALVGLLGS